MLDNVQINISFSVLLHYDLYDPQYQKLSINQWKSMEIPREYNFSLNESLMWSIILKMFAQ